MSCCFVGTTRSRLVHGTNGAAQTHCGRVPTKLYDRDFAEYATTYPTLVCKVCRRAEGLAVLEGGGQGT